MISALFISSFLSGIASFYFSGGFTALASDVGISGAWLLLIIFQVIYSLLIFLGFIIFALISNKYNVTSPSLVPTSICASIVSVSVSLFGVYATGPGIEFIYLCLLIISISTILFFIITKAYNGLTS